MELTGSSFSLHGSAPKAEAVTPAPAAAASKHDFSFGDFLDIINPLQHLPVVGTIYRAVTHDEIETPEKLVGDALYGGVWGLVSSLADTAFQSATGKTFGDTVLSWFTGHHETQAVGTEVAQAPMPAPSREPEQALTQSLSRGGVDPDLQQRALFAYRRTVSAFAE